VYTAWKRVYVERDRMFRRGGVLAADYNHVTASPKNRIRVWNWTHVQPGDRLALFQADRPAESPGAEYATIKNPIVDGGDGKTVLLDLDLGLDGQGQPILLQQDYSASINPSTGDMDFAYGQSAAVGIISGCDASANQINGANSCFYDADLRDVKQPFTDAYVEVLAPREGMGAVPYVAGALEGFYVSVPGEGTLEPGRTLRRTFQEAWFQHKNAADNLHVLGVRGKDPQGGSGIGGFTWPYSLYHFIHVETLEQLEPESTLRRIWSQTVNDHEMGHQFYVDKCSGGHDSRDAWCHGESGPCNGQPCLMGPDGGSPLDQENRFCVPDLLSGDPNCGDGDGSIRRMGSLNKTE
jgi:hypothetical protein